MSELEAPLETSSNPHLNGIKNRIYVHRGKPNCFCPGLLLTEAPAFPWTHCNPCEQDLQKHSSIPFNSIGNISEDSHQGMNCQSSLWRYNTSCGDTYRDKCANYQVGTRKHYPKADRIFGTLVALKTRNGLRSLTTTYQKAHSQQSLDISEVVEDRNLCGFPEDTSI